LREFVIPAKRRERASGAQKPAASPKTGGPPKPGAAPKPPAASAPKNEEPVVVLAEREPQTKKELPRGPVRQRDFIVEYDGRFIGHYHAVKPLTARIAFGQVARELRTQVVHFTAEKLALYRPHKLRVKGLAAAEVAAAGGEFLWFLKK
jgi:hypothetical protein